MRTLKITGLWLALFMLSHVWVYAQSSEQHIEKLVLNKKEKKVFNSRDSSVTVYIDTLVMKDRSSLQFFGKKDVRLVITHAEIGNNVFITGNGARNNASNFNIEVNFNKLGSMTVVARGQDAMNGTKTHPNGDAGNVTLIYNANGIKPQTTDKKAKNFLVVDVRPGGLNVTPSSDVNRIYDQIKSAPTGLRGIPQGQIYSGSPGKEGEVIIKSNIDE